MKGLENIGNTCFMNSCLQILMNCDPLVKYIKSKKYNDDLNPLKRESQLFIDFVNLLTEQKAISIPIAFKKTLELFQSSYIGYRQHDSCEVMIHILDIFHDALKYETNMKIIGKGITKHAKLCRMAYEIWISNYRKEYSFLVETFHGQYHSQIICNECRTITHQFDPFSFIYLPINNVNNGDNIYDCFRKFTDTEILDNDNKYMCENCNKKVVAIKKTRLWKLPNILIIGFKRFNNAFMKIDKNIEYFYNLDLVDYYEQTLPCEYELFGVSIHEGGISGGHYYSYCLVNNIWYKFNDSDVSQISSEKVIDKNAYFLVFRKK